MGWWFCRRDHMSCSSVQNVESNMNFPPNICPQLGGVECIVVLFVEPLSVQVWICRKIHSSVFLCNPSTCIIWNCCCLEVFSVTRRSRSDSHYWLTDWLTYSALALTWLMLPWWVMIPTEDFTDVTLAIEDADSRASLTVRILRYEIEKGLRAV